MRTYQVYDVNDEEKATRDNKILKQFKTDMRAEFGFIILKNGDSFIVDISGNGHDLINLLCNVLAQDEHLQAIFEMALVNERMRINNG